MTKRRSKGDGSVYQRGDSGRFVGEYDDARGKRRYVSGKSKADVKAKLRKLLADRDNGIAYDAGNQTVETYLQAWLKTVKHTVRVSTYERHEQLVRVHISPKIGSVKLDKLSVNRINQLYQDKLDQGLAPNTVRRIHATLSRALNDAVKQELIPRNVTASAMAPSWQEREINALSQEQVKTLLETAKRMQPKLYPLYVLAVTTAARAGELLPLMHADVRGGKLRITKTLWRGTEGPPKTAHGRRVILLPKLAREALEAHTSGSELLFPNGAGKPMDYSGFTRRWKALLEAAGLPRTTRFHDLRVTAITLMLSQGVNPKVVTEIAGHSDVAFTMRVYQASLPQMHDAAVRAMDGLLG